MNQRLKLLQETISTVSDNLNFKQSNFKPTISFEKDKVIFKVSILENLNQYTKKSLQTRYTPVFKKIFESAKQELLDAKAEYKLSYKFENADLKIHPSRGGSRSKSKVDYMQTWTLDMIGLANTVATF